INRQQGHLVEAEKNFRSVLEDKTQAMLDRKFDFSMDYEVINLLGQTLFDLAKQSHGPKRQGQRETYLRQAVEQFEKTLRLDSENVAAHFNLQHLYAQLGDKAKSEEHHKLHLRYKLDDNASDRAMALARQKYRAANHAAESVVVYALNREGAPGLAGRVGQARFSERRPTIRDGAAQGWSDGGTQRRRDQQTKRNAVTFSPSLPHSFSPSITGGPARARARLSHPTDTGGGQ
ncbi:MAG: tetratricopeptide repeat protein, partial [Pirellulales bacterium]